MFSGADTELARFPVSRRPRRCTEQPQET